MPHNQTTPSMPPIRICRTWSFISAGTRLDEPEPIAMLDNIIVGMPTIALVSFPARILVGVGSSNILHHTQRPFCVPCSRRTRRRSLNDTASVTWRVRANRQAEAIASTGCACCRGRRAHSRRYMRARPVIPSATTARSIRVRALGKIRRSIAGAVAGNLRTAAQSEQQQLHQAWTKRDARARRGIGRARA